MMEEIESFYDHLNGFYSEIIKIRTQTVSTQEFKNKAISTYTIWKTKIEPSLSNKIERDVLSDLNDLFEKLYQEARRRVADVNQVKALLGQVNDLYLREVVTLLRRIDLSEPEVSLKESAKFLDLDTNWFSATCALQLQEVAMKIVADRKNIKLDRKNVERILNKKIQQLSFNQRYEAFRMHIENSTEIKMPILPTHLRRMRVKGLHEGYNPKPEETRSIVSFTAGLLEKLEKISQS